MLTRMKGYGLSPFLTTLISLRPERFRVINETAIINIPTFEGKSGFLFSRIIQLKIAPKTGMRNFQTFKTDTFTPGRRNNTNQMEIVAADKKLSQLSAA